MARASSKFSFVDIAPHWDFVQHAVTDNLDFLATVEADS